MKKEAGFTGKLGMFVTIGIVLFVVTIYFIGRQKNLFGSTFHLKSHFKTVSGLKIGNNVRFSGITIGTVDDIILINDTAVMVDLVIEKDVQKFIKSDAKTSISSDGLMGDKVLIITGGTAKTFVKDNDSIGSKSTIDMEDIMISMKKSLDNIGLISEELAVFSNKMNTGNGALAKLISDEDFSKSLQNTLFNLQISSDEFAKFTIKMNDKNGALSRLMNDEAFGNSLDSTMQNLKTGSKSLSENMEAVKSNFLLKSYFKRKEKADALKKAQQNKLIKPNINKTTKPTLQDSLKY